MCTVNFPLSSTGEDIYLYYILMHTVICLDDFQIIHYHSYHLMIGLSSIPIENLNMSLSCLGENIICNT